MCGIAGFVGKSAPEVAQRMGAALRHRGPDDQGIWACPETGVHLVHRRLSIVDIGGGHQPMWDAAHEIGIIFNGEIYNHVDVRRELMMRGHKFQTDHSDTEVLIEGYRAWGEEVTKHIDGMWAFVLIDRRRKKLFLSRDRFGEKPLYYSHGNGVFAFASELTALFEHDGVRQDISRLSLAKYFSHGYVPAPRTIFDGIYQLSAGHSASLDLISDKLDIVRYWSYVIDPMPETSLASEGRLAEELREILQRTVKERFMADVPVGLLLSGGIDSSAIACLAAEQGVPLQTFSIGFAEATFDESVYAAQVAKHIGARHVVDVLSVERASELVEETLAHLDHPMADPSLLPCDLLFRHVGQHAKVAIGGDGSDELFAGYETFKALKWAKLYEQVVPKSLHRPLEFIAGLLPISHNNMSFDYKLRRMLQGLQLGPRLWNAGWLSPVNTSQLAALGLGGFSVEEIYSESIAAWEACPQGDLVGKTSQFYVNLYLQSDILTKVDRSSMMHSVECRAPFLGLSLSEFVRRLPSSYKLRGQTTKYLLKKAIAKDLPADILQRSKKGFGIPLGKWLSEGRLSFSGQQLSKVVDRQFLDRLMQEHQEQKANHGSTLWAAIVLDRFLSRKPDWHVVA